MMSQQRNFMTSLLKYDLIQLPEISVHRIESPFKSIYSEKSIILESVTLFPIIKLYFFPPRLHMHLNKSVQTNISSMVLYYQYITVRIRGSHVRSDKHFFYGLILPVHYSEDSWILRPFRQTFLLLSYITSTLQCVSITL